MPGCVGELWYGVGRAAELGGEVCAPGRGGDVAAPMVEDGVFGLPRFGPKAPNRSISRQHGIGIKLCQGCGTLTPVQYSLFQCLDRRSTVPDNVVDAFTILPICPILAVVDESMGITSSFVASHDAPPEVPRQVEVLTSVVGWLKLHSQDL